MKYLAILLILAGCGAQYEPVKQDDKVVVPKVPLVTTVTFKRYSLSSNEHIFIIDVPDRYVPRRCMIFVNEETKTTTPISCNFDDAGSPLPEQGAE